MKHKASIIVAATISSLRSLTGRSRSLRSAVVILLGIVGCCALPASAETYYLATSEGAIGGFTNACRWATASGIPGEGYVSASHDYVVRNGYTLRLIDYGGEFGGNSLTIGAEDGSTAGVLDCRLALSKYGRSGLFLRRGGVKQTIRAGFGAVLEGPVTVTATGASPFQFGVQNERCGLEFSGTFSGGADAAALFGHADAISGSASNIWVYLSGPVDYHGSIVVTSRYANSQQACGTLFASRSAIAGSVTIRAGAGLRPYSASDTLEIGTLNLDAGSQLKPLVGATGLISVADALNVNAPVMLAADDVPSGAPLLVPILRGPAGVRIDPSVFAFTPKTGQYGTPHVETDAGTNRDTLYVRLLPVVTLVQGDPSSKDQAGGGSAFTNATSWSNGRVPEAGFCYQVSGNSIRSTVEDVDYDFPGEALVLDNSRLYLFGKRAFHFGELVMRGNSSIWKGQGAASPEVLVSADALKVEGTASFGAYTHQTNTVSAPLFGGASATIRCTGVSSTGAYNIRGYYRFTGINTNYFGRFRVTQPDLAWNTDIQRQVLLVDDARNLGGDLDAFDFRALQLDCAGTVRPLADITLPAASNRGLFVDGVGIVEVPEGTVFDMRAPLTLNGQLVKAGSGELRLGAPTRYYDEGLDAAGPAPRAGSNLLSVVEGALRPTAHDSLDGATVAFSAGSRLVLPLDPGNESQMRYGILDAKAGTPFELGDGLSSLPLEIDTSACPAIPDGGIEFGMATVTNLPATVAAVRSMMPCPRPYQGFSSSLVERVNDGEGTITFVLKVIRRATCVIVR